jgi:hypothetical protein
LVDTQQADNAVLQSAMQAFSFFYLASELNFASGLYSTVYPLHDTAISTIQVLNRQSVGSIDSKSVGDEPADVRYQSINTNTNTC